MSTARSQLYRFARDLGNGEAVEHGIMAANLRVSLIGNLVAGFFLSQAYSNLIWLSLP